MIINGFNICLIFQKMAKSSERNRYLKQNWVQWRRREDGLGFETELWKVEWEEEGRWS